MVPTFPVCGVWETDGKLSEAIPYITGCIRKSFPRLKTGFRCEVTCFFIRWPWVNPWCNQPLWSGVKFECSHCSSIIRNIILHLFFLVSYQVLVLSGGLLRALLFAFSFNYFVSRCFSYWHYSLPFFSPDIFHFFFFISKIPVQIFFISCHCSAQGVSRIRCIPVVLQIDFSRRVKKKRKKNDLLFWLGFCFPVVTCQDHLSHWRWQGRFLFIPFYFADSFFSPSVPSRFIRFVLLLFILFFTPSFDVLFALCTLFSFLIRP